MHRECSISRKYRRASLHNRRIEWKESSTERTITRLSEILDKHARLPRSSFSGAGLPPPPVSLPSNLQDIYEAHPDAALLSISSRDSVTFYLLLILRVYVQRVFRFSLSYLARGKNLVCHKSCILIVKHRSYSSPIVPLAPVETVAVCCPKTFSNDKQLPHKQFASLRAGPRRPSSTGRWYPSRRLFENLPTPLA